MQVKFSNEGVEPISIEEAKKYMRIDYDNEDMLISLLVSGVRRRIEEFTGRSLVSRTVELFLPEVPEEIKLPYPDHDAITEVEINGTTSTAYIKTGLNQFILRPTTVTTTQQNESGFYVKYTTLGNCPEWVKIEMLKSIDEKYRNRGNTFEGSLTDLSENTYSNLAQYCLM